MKLRNKSQLCQNGNWIINLFVLLCNFNTIISKPCSNESDPDLPIDWPCQWSDGTIPFVFNFFSISPRRLITLVRRGHAFLESRSCLKFKEYNPMDLVKKHNFTYLFYSYSGVLENCCLPYYTNPVGRRLVLVTPTCTLPAEVAHVTLHGLGVTHPRRLPISESSARAVMFPSYCPEIEDKMKAFGLYI